MPPDDTTRWILIGGALAVAFYLLVLRPKMRKPRRGDPLERGGELSRQRSVEREMSTILVELTEMSRQVSAQLDTRATRLEVLIQQADERIAMLQSLQTLGDNGGALPGLQNKPFASQASTSSAPSLHAMPEDPRHAEVYALADQGNSASEIASRLGRPNGEIQLILALRSRS